MELDLTKTFFGRNETLNIRCSWLNERLREFKQNKE